VKEVMQKINNQMLLNVFPWLQKMAEVPAKKRWRNSALKLMASTSKTTPVRETPKNHGNGMALPIDTSISPTVS
jgi:hypothetical protein